MTGEKMTWRLGNIIIAMLMVLPWTLCANAQTVHGDSLTLNLYTTKAYGAQSAACYGDYALFVGVKVGRMSLFNMKTRTRVCSQKLSPKNELRGKTDIYHANNCCFGVKKYSKNDSLPLLYVSHRENNELRGVLEVYRVTPVSRDTLARFDSLAVQLVQTIYYPCASDDNALGSPWTAIDLRKGYMYTYSRNNKRKTPNYGRCRISKFKIPKVNGRPEVYLTDRDIIDTFDGGYNAVLSQGGCIWDNKLYIAQGIPKENSTSWLREIDLVKRELTNSYNLSKAGLQEEPEGCFVYDGQLMIATAKGSIYQVTLP